MTLPLDIPSRRELERLLQVRRPGCVSIYLPTTPLPHEADADRIELKNLAAEAVRQLEEGDIDKKDVAAVREVFEELDDDEDFWMHQANSLAVFTTPETTLTFRLPNRLVPLVDVADRFHLKPLLRTVTFPQAAFVLALSQNAVAVYEIAPDLPPTELQVHGMPADAASAVGKSSLADRGPDRRIQGSEGRKVRLRQYARQVDTALRPVVGGADLPLILAAAEPLDGIFRSVCSYPHLVADGIPGSPDRTPPAELAAAARPILDAIYAEQLAEIRDEFEARRPEGRASVDIVDVARAATYGAVDTVLVDIDNVVPGEVDESGAVTFAAEDDAVAYGVVDEIARRVLLSGGRVLAVRRPDIPDEEPVAAILRYPV